MVYCKKILPPPPPPESELVSTPAPPFTEKVPVEFSYEPTTTLIDPPLPAPLAPPPPVVAPFPPSATKEPLWVKVPEMERRIIPPPIPALVVKALPPEDPKKRGLS